MDLKETNKKLSQLKADEQTREAILGLIDDKINNGMENAITRFEASIHKLESSIESLNSKIDASNSKIDNIKWFIGAAVAIAVGLAKIFKMF